MSLPLATAVAYTPEERAILDAEVDRCAVLNQSQADLGEVRQVLKGATVTGFTFGDLKTVQFPDRATLLARGDTPILRAGQLSQLYAERGIGKTLLTRSLAIVMAGNGEVLGFNAPFASRVLYIDGEMASEDIQNRDRLLAKLLDLPVGWHSHNLVTVARDWQEEGLHRLDTEEGQTAIDDLVEWAEVIILDNRACLFDPEGEKDGTAWQPAQDWLLSLRRRGKAVILVHHSNRGGGSRGLGRAEDALDLVIKLEKPQGYSQEQGARFVLSYEKARGIPGGDALRQFTAALTPDGWICEGTSSGNDLRARARRKVLECVRSASNDGEPIPTKTQGTKGIGVQVKAAMSAWDELVMEGAIIWRDDPEGFHLAD